MAQFRICEFQAIFDMIFQVSKNFYSLLYWLNNSNSQLPTVSKTTKSTAYRRHRHIIIKLKDLSYFSTLLKTMPWYKVSVGL